MEYSLPVTVDVGGTARKINSDFRAVLDLMEALDSPDLDGRERALAALLIFYPDFGDIPPECGDEAVEKCLWFVRGGEEDLGKRSPRLVDWKKDCRYIFPPVSKALGVLDVRAMDYLHWWTFLSGYMGMGDCFFAQVVGIRHKLAKHEKLDKYDKQFYRENRDVIILQQRLTDKEKVFLEAWAGKR